MRIIGFFYYRIIIRACFFHSNLVRHAAARVVAAIASIEVIHGTWPELLPFVNQACHASQASHREVGIYILYAVLENAFEAFQKHLPAIFKLFEQTVVDPESIDVRITTVKYTFSSLNYMLLLIRHQGSRLYCPIP